MTTSTRTAAKPVFAPDDDVPIRYIQRTREYYLALGYDNPYRWAHFADVRVLVVISTPALWYVVGDCGVVVFMHSLTGLDSFTRGYPRPDSNSTT